MKKAFPLFMVVLTILLLLRVSFGNDRPLNISRSLAVSGEYGSFFDFDDVFLDVQKIQWNFKGLTNALTASAGSSYVTYSWVSGQHGAHSPTTVLEPEQIIVNKQGIEVGHFSAETEQKPAWSAWVTEWLAFVSRFLGYIGSMFVSIGGLLIDVLSCLIRSLYGALMLIYYLCTT